ncbi:MAG: hypothetical protein RIS47_755, partial [Bacteroidota bacterium]
MTRAHAHTQPFVDWYLSQKQILTEFKPKTADAESLHRLRVALKKIRAWDQFICHTTHNKTGIVSTFSQIKVIFKASGRVRDLLVVLDLLQRYETTNELDYPRFRSYLGKKIQQNSEKFTSEYSKKFCKKLDELEFCIFDNIRLAADEFTEEKLSEFFRASLQKLYTQSRKVKKTIDLHEFRKHFKTQLYILEIIRTRYPDFHTQLSETTFETQANEIGLWYDKEMLLQLLERYFKKYP